MCLVHIVMLSKYSNGGEKECRLNFKAVARVVLNDGDAFSSVQKPLQS